jgi:hypothetical protein
MKQKIQLFILFGALIFLIVILIVTKKITIENMDNELPVTDDKQREQDDKEIKMISNNLGNCSTFTASTILDLLKEYNKTSRDYSIQEKENPNSVKDIPPPQLDAQFVSEYLKKFPVKKQMQIVEEVGFGGLKTIGKMYMEQYQYLLKEINTIKNK